MWNKSVCQEIILQILVFSFCFPFSSVTQSCLTLCNPMDCRMPGLPVHHQLPEFTQTHVHWVGDFIQPSHPLSSPSPPAFNLPQHLGLFNESVLCIRWPKYWSFSFSISPSSEYSGLISFRMDWLLPFTSFLKIVQTNPSAHTLYFQAKNIFNFFMWHSSELPYLKLPFV